MIIILIIGTIIKDGLLLAQIPKDGEFRMRRDRH